MSDMAIVVFPTDLIQSIVGINEGLSNLRYENAPHLPSGTGFEI
jgi:hypothetical protein